MDWATGKSSELRTVIASIAKAIGHPELSKALLDGDWGAMAKEIALNDELMLVRMSSLSDRAKKLINVAVDAICAKAINWQTVISLMGEVVGISANFTCKLLKGESSFAECVQQLAPKVGLSECEMKLVSVPCTLR